MRPPRLETARLVLRTLRPSDSASIYHHINDPDIAANTLGIPYPFPKDSVVPYIERNLERAAAGTYVPFAIALKPDDVIIGYIRLTIDDDHRRAELAYWLGKLYWGQGYVTEAAALLVQFGFERLHLNRIYAFCFADNTASWRVMQKIGMTYEGTWRSDVLKNSVYKDVAIYGILRSDYFR